MSRGTRMDDKRVLKWAQDTLAVEHRCQAIEKAAAAAVRSTICSAR